MPRKRDTVPAGIDETENAWFPSFAAVGFGLRRSSAEPPARLSSERPELVSADPTALPVNGSSPPIGGVPRVEPVPQTGPPPLTHEPASPQAPAEHAELRVTKDRRPLARLRLLHRNPVFVVECDVYPVGLALVDPRPLGPYTFQRRDDALAFLQDAAHALGYLGCVVDDPFALVDQAAQIG